MDLDTTGRKCEAISEILQNNSKLTIGVRGFARQPKKDFGFLNCGKKTKTKIFFERNAFLSRSFKTTFFHQMYFSKKI